nr:immunoglobulin light chain junction region [Macaca mulatta]
CLQYNIYPLTF